MGHGATKVVASLGTVPLPWVADHTQLAGTIRFE